MIFTETPLPGAFLVDLERRGDARGFFARSFCAQEFGARGLATTFVQANTSYSVTPGTVRGLHFQRAPHTEAKFVRCIQGAIWDVIVDLRPGSDTRGRSFAVELSAANERQIYVPRGFAHGFQVLTANSVAAYLVDAAYAPEAEGGLRYDDPALDIAWPLPVTVVSEKDRGWPPITDDLLEEIGV